MRSCGFVETSIVIVGVTTEEGRTQSQGMDWVRAMKQETTLLNLRLAMDSVANTFLKEEEKHRITYKSGTAESQIGYILCRVVERVTLEIVNSYWERA